jgi:hypothetical protein
VWIREFLGGLDARRLPETTPGGVLIQAYDGHITRGGEFEKRAAFVPTYELPAGTVGLHKQKAGLIVFGNGPTPSGMPSGIAYQRLQHPDGPEIELINVPSVDLYSGRVYAVAEFADGSRFHYYDGVRVEDWFDGRARATFRVINGSSTSAVAAQGSVTVLAGSVGAGNQITNVQVNGVSIINTPVSFATSNSVTASNLATAINAFSSSPDYTASAAGATVTITAVNPGAAPNGYAINVIEGGDVDTSNTPMANGANAVTSTLNSVTIDGVAITNSPVLWSVSNSQLAQDIADEINTAISDPEYEAVSVEDQVIILATNAGTEPNGKSVVTAVSGGLVLSPASGLAMADGVELDDVYEPGTFVKTIGAKMYSVSGPNLHFSGIQEPTQWTTDAVGAGFVDMSSYESGSEELKAVARYQSNIAIFAETNVQIWFVDPDPTLNRQSQVLNNTGTVSPRSVTQFSDNDLFYLSESGLRSLRAREATNSASTTDIGVPIDPLITEKLRNMSQAERNAVVGLIEPQEGRFWLIMGRDIFVFSFFSGAQVSAWSRYGTSVTTDGVTTYFDMNGAVVYNRRVYLRASDTIYCYGGIGSATEYDETQAIAQIPYLDADDPTKNKNWQAIDAAAQGLWNYTASMRTKNPNAQDVVATVDGSSFADGRIGMAGWSTHISIIAKTIGPGYARLGSFILHYEGSTNDD